jgi:hypothetical protein
MQKGEKMTMATRPLLLLALATLGSMSTLAPAAAGACCACDPACVPPAVVFVVPQPVYVKPIYIVNRGPVYGGPGIITRPLKKHFNRPLADYPYVGRDFYYPPYNPYATLTHSYGWPRD